MNDRSAQWSEICTRQNKNKIKSGKKRQIDQTLIITTIKNTYKQKQRA